MVRVAFTDGGGFEVPENDGVVGAAGGEGVAGEGGPG